jgi:hypothetical protein
MKTISIIYLFISFITPTLPNPKIPNLPLTTLLLTTISDPIGISGIMWTLFRSISNIRHLRGGNIRLGRERGNLRNMMKLRKINSWNC